VRAPRSGLDPRFLVGAFAAVALTFLAAYVVSQQAMRRIDAASDDIAFNSAPSIERLAAVRTAVRHAEFLLGTALTLGDAKDRAAVDSALAQLNSDANAYLALPTFPGEKQFWGELNESIIGFNSAVQRVLAQSDAGAVGVSRSGIAGVATAGDRVSAAAVRAIEFNAHNGRELALQVKAVRRSSAIVGYLLNAACVVFAAATAVLVQRQLRRHSALVEEHAALQESRARELESFAGRAAHDILNPVAATQMALTLAIKREAEDGHTRELLQRALRNQVRAQKIIDGLLQFARAGARPERGATADVPSVIDDVAAGIRPKAEAAGIELCLEHVAPCVASCSVGVLTSVISNLAHNAIKYMGEGRTRNRIGFRAEERGGVVHVEVEDTGPGIPPDAVKDIFVAFVRGPTQGKDGLGLGLATVKRLCEAHGGRAGVRTSVGRGSVFWIEIPSFDAAAEAIPTSASVAGSTLGERVTGHSGKRG
jgi:signal transduction histidine kinase